MRAEELLWLYDLGERNFRERDLKSVSLSGEDLSGADFSGSDIRGADFSNAILRDAKFAHVRAGLAPQWTVVLFAVLVALSGILGAFIGYTGVLEELRLHSTSLEEVLTKTVALIVLICFSALSYLQGIAIGFSFFPVAFFLALLPGIVVSAALPIAATAAIAVTMDALVTIAAVIAGASVIAALVAIHRVAAVTVAVGFVLALMFTIIFANTSGSVIAIATAIFVLSVYLGWRVLRGDERHSLLQRLILFLATRWSTSFRGADLTNADFSEAQIKGTNFSEAVLRRTKWDACDRTAIHVSYSGM